ncbi:MAG: HNH endonuclease [Terriglobia bacterium]
MGPFLVATVGFGLFYKLGQALFDEDYPGTTVPLKVREELIRRYVSMWGWVCPKCDRRTHDLQVDHIVAIAASGRNSRENLQILCGTCNLKKGVNLSVWDAFRGRFADK